MMIINIEDLMIPAGKRFSPPKHIEETRSQAPLDLIKHHIIPFNRLRETFNHLVTHELEKPQGQLSSELKNFLKNANCSTVDINTFHLLIRHARGDKNAPEIPETFDHKDLCDTIRANVSWPTWDLMEGPSHRDDDPGREFDDFSNMRHLNKSTKKMVSALKVIDATLCKDLQTEQISPRLSKTVKSLNRLTSGATTRGITLYNERSWLQAGSVASGSNSPIRFVQNNKSSVSPRGVSPDTSPDFFSPGR